MFGYKAEEVIGEVAFKLFVPGRFNLNYSQFYNFLRRVESSLQGRVLEYIAAKKDGTEFPVELLDFLAANSRQVACSRNRERHK